MMNVDVNTQDSRLQVQARAAHFGVKIVARVFSERGMAVCWTFVDNADGYKENMVLQLLLCSSIPLPQCPRFVPLASATDPGRLLSRLFGTDQPA
jgi:hypothetical protein